MDARQTPPLRPTAPAAAAAPAVMIDVGGKPVTARMARAVARLVASAATIERVRLGTLEKGDALAVARVAGIMAAKQTSAIVPLCHPLPLDSVAVDVGFDDPAAITITATVRAVARTGVEMEALVAAGAAALAIYDMAKSLEPGMSIEGMRLEEKTGGTRGDWTRGEGRRKGAGPSAPR